MTPQVQTGMIFDQTNEIPTVLLESLHQSVLESFKIMCGSASFIGEGASIEQDSVVGVISFVGDIVWSLILGLPENSAVTIAKKFAGMEVDFDSPDMGEVIGELANVLAGVVNGKLQNAGLTSHMSLPTVARGSHVRLLLPGNLLKKNLIFSSAEAEFWVKVVVAKPL